MQKCEKCEELQIENNYLKGQNEELKNAIKNMWGDLYSAQNSIKTAITKMEAQTVIRK